MELQLWGGPLDGLEYEIADDAAPEVIILASNVFGSADFTQHIYACNRDDAAVDGRLRYCGPRTDA